jgi:hypothetical protein
LTVRGSTGKLEHKEAQRKAEKEEAESKWIVDFLRPAIAYEIKSGMAIAANA